jgi:hypothetical protein
MQPLSLQPRGFQTCALFGLVGAYSTFILVHRQAFRSHGITALGWLILVIGMNLGLGFVVPHGDKYTHVGGLLSGCLLGWFFPPFSQVNPVAIAQNGPSMLTDIPSLKRRWPLALLLIALTVLSAIIALPFVGGYSFGSTNRYNNLPGAGQTGARPGQWARSRHRLCPRCAARA